MGGPVPVASTFQQNNSNQRQGTGSSSANQEKAPAAPIVCYSCGQLDHKRNNCPLVNHVDRNTSRDTWADSDIGKAYAALGARHLTFDKCLDEHKPGGWNMGYAMPPPSREGQSGHQQQGRQQQNPNRQKGKPLLATIVASADTHRHIYVNYAFFD